MKRFQQLMVMKNELPPKAPKQRNTSISGIKPPTFFNLIIQKKQIDNQKRKQIFKIEPDMTRKRANSFQSLIEVTNPKKLINQSSSTKNNLSNNSFNKNNLFSQLSTKNSNKMIPRPSLNNFFRKQINQQKIQWKKPEQHKKQLIRGIQLTQSITASKQDKGKQTYLNQITPSQTKEIQAGIKKVKQNLMLKLIQKNTGINKNIEDIVNKMKNQLTKETDKLIQNFIQKKITPKQLSQPLSNQTKKQRTPTTEKTLGTPCFEQYTFKKVDQIPVNEFSIFCNTKQNNSTSHEKLNFTLGQQNLLKDISINELSTFQMKRGSNTTNNQSSNRNKQQNKNLRYHKGEEQKNILCTKKIKNSIISGRRNSTTKKVEEIVINEFKLD